VSREKQLLTTLLLISCLFTLKLVSTVLAQLFHYCFLTVVQVYLKEAAFLGHHLGFYIFFLGAGLFWIRSRYHDNLYKLLHITNLILTVETLSLKNIKIRWNFPYLSSDHYPISLHRNGVSISSIKLYNMYYDFDTSNG